MPKNVSITKEQVDAAIFELVRTEGMEALTARNIAKKADCSTQPIYKIYKNLQELRENAVRMVVEYIERFIFGYRKTGRPFFDAGLGFIRLAANEKMLFRTFVTGNYLQQKVFAAKESARLHGLMEEHLGPSPLSAAAREALFFDAMAYTNGLAHLAYSGQLNMDEDQVVKRLMAFFNRMSGIRQ